MKIGDVSYGNVFTVAGIPHRYISLPKNLIIAQDLEDQSLHIMDISLGCDAVDPPVEEARDYTDQGGRFPEADPRYQAEEERKAKSQPPIEPREMPSLAIMDLDRRLAILELLVTRLSAGQGFDKLNGLTILTKDLDEGAVDHERRIKALEGKE